MRGKIQITFTSRNKKRVFQLMKDRRRLQIIDGLRHSSDTRRNQRAMCAQEIPIDEDESVARLLRGQVGSSLASGLKASEQRLSALLHDRDRIGRELHDSVLQALYAIGLSP